jgi:flagellar biogenesis protein FliO
MDSVGLLTQLGTRAGLAILLAVGAVAYLRRLPRFRAPFIRRRSSLRVVETTPLGQSRALHLIEAGSRSLLIGSTPSQVALLADLTGDPAPAEALTEPEPSAFIAGSVGFAAVLARLLPSPEAGPAGGPTRRLQAAAEALRTGGALP